MIEVRDKLGWGNFDSWLKSEFDWSRSTAYKFINVASICPPGRQIDLISPKALYLIFSSSTPAEARTEALSLAESGEKITYSVAKEIADRHKAEMEAATKEIAEKQQALFTLEDRTKTLEDHTKTLEYQLHKAIIERDQMRLNKQADDAAIIRQDEL